MMIVLLIIVIGISLMAANAYNIWFSSEVDNKLCDISDKLDKIANPGKHSAGHVTDPFKTASRRGLEPTRNSKHVIKPKSPDEIRAENFNEIKNGSRNYGWNDNN